MVEKRVGSVAHPTSTNSETGDPQHDASPLYMSLFEQKVRNPARTNHRL